MQMIVYLLDLFPHRGQGLLYRYTEFVKTRDVQQTSKIRESSRSSFLPRPRRILADRILHRWWQCRATPQRNKCGWQSGTDNPAFAYPDAVLQSTPDAPSRRGAPFLRAHFFFFGRVEPELENPILAGVSCLHGDAQRLAIDCNVSRHRLALQKAPTS